MNLQGLKINFLGDSITEGHGCSSEETRFTSLIASQHGAITRCYGIGGTNDFGHGDAPFGDFSDRTADTFCGAIHELYVSLLEKYPTATIMVITPLHRSTEDIPNMHGKVLKDYVDVIRRGAEYYSLPVLDLYATYGVQPAVPVMKDTFMPDGLHPNDAGHVILTNKIAQFIKNL